MLRGQSQDLIAGGWLNTEHNNLLDLDGEEALELEGRAPLGRLIYTLAAIRLLHGDAVRLKEDQGWVRWDCLVKRVNAGCV